MIFDQQIFLLSSIIIHGWLYEHSISPLAVNCLRICELTDPQSNYLPLKLPKT